MNKILHVAKREFLATVATKGFIIGVLITPAVIATMILVLPRLMNEKAPRVEGEVVVIDPTGKVAAAVQDYLSPRAIARRREEEARKAAENTPAELRAVAEASGQSEASRQQMQAILGEVPDLRVVVLPADADLEKEKEPLKAGDIRKGDGGRLAIAVVKPDAVERAPGKTGFGTYDLYVRASLDDRVEDEIHAGLRNAIVTARVQAIGLDRDQIEALTRVPRTRSVSVSAQGEHRTSDEARIFLPLGFLVLMLVSVLTSGQQLMTTTIEEKSNRVVEILLSAVSPMQLMTGKILGQMAVGLLILSLYAGLGIASLMSFAMMGLLNPWLLLYLLLFFLITYFTLASFMAAIGSSVNELREAQTLMTPVTLMLMIPWLLWMPITRNPNSAFSTVISMLPPVNSIAMLLRMTSSTPPPLWQVWTSVAIGIGSVYVALWFAKKVFRIGLLMYGKPPNFATLARWARMA